MNILRTSLLTLFIGLILFSCSDDNPTNTNGNLTIGTLTVTMDGATWTSMNAYATKGGSSVSVAGAKTINNNQGTESLGLAIVNAQVGNVTATATFTIMPNISNPMASELWLSSNVTCNITSMTATEIEGTFSFDASYNEITKQFRNGKFRVKFLN
jgi:hypothetical protein